MTELNNQLLRDLQRLIGLVEKDLTFTEDFEWALGELSQTLNVYQSYLEETKKKGA